MIAKVDAEQPAQMCAQRGYDETAPTEITRHEGQQRQDMIGADDEYIGPVEPKRNHACRQHQSLIRGNGSSMIRSGQYRVFYSWWLNCHSEVGIPISAPDAVG